MSMLVNGRATYIIMDIRSVPALAIFFKRLLSISRMSKYKAKVSKIMRMMFKKYVMIKVIFFSPCSFITGFADNQINSA